MDPKSSITRAESDFLMVLDDSTQRLERDFRKIERRFVMKVLNEEGDVNSIWTHYSSRVRYYDMGLWLRVEWFRSKGEVIEMEQRVDRITARKISHQLHIALGYARSLLFAKAGYR